MYRELYSLKELPFQMNMDPKFIWFGERHKDILTVLKYAAVENEGFLLVTGDVGTGKTTLVNALLKCFDKNTVTANITNPKMEPRDFLDFVAHEFNIQLNSGDKKNSLALFRRFLSDCHGENKHVVLIIDEAHRLDQKLLNQIRRLSNIEQRNKKLLNIVFVGQDSFVDLISKKKNRDLKQRITFRHHLNPLKGAEICEYIFHRLHVAGSVKSIFTGSAIAEVYAASKGYPCWVNMICDRALWVGYQKGAKEIDGRIIKECLDNLPVWKEKIDEEKTRKDFKTQNHGAAKEPAIDFSRRKFQYIAVAAVSLMVLGLLYYPLKSGRHARNGEKYGQTQSTSTGSPSTVDSNKKIDREARDAEKVPNTVSELKQKESTAIRLVPAGSLLNEEKRTDDRPTVSTVAKKTGSNGPKNGMHREKYIIYLHYTGEDKKELMEALANSLKNSGFGVLGVERVDYQNSDVRYFHREDKAGALLLKNHLTQFMAPLVDLENTNIKIKNLSRQYPNARKGAIELWLNL
jgi:type II secretory pathway predicted ATPase ExeA